MSPFYLLKLLPPFLTVKYEATIYENMTPALIQRGSRIWLSYVGRHRELVLYERAETDEELEAAVLDYSKRLQYLEVFEADILF